MPEWYQAHRLSTRDRNFVSTEYLSRQLIAYIGNKRRILGFLYRIFSELQEKNELQRFADPFAGSGAVSRLARQMGMDVWANDWEEYSRVLNSAYLRLRPEETDGLFAKWGGLAPLLQELNSSKARPRTPFISRFYGPRETEKADYRTERLFYTRENALFIDRTRERIEELFPVESIQSENEMKARDLLLALLLYEAATHVNTSGVFKAFHKGFGGHGRDALQRIMAPMDLEYPVLCGSPGKAIVENMDAAAFLKGISADLVYLDPPYTIHQYGSNYHLLNTIAKWDFPSVDNSCGENGRLKRKGGIREDWTTTRSPFCYRKSAPTALREVLDAADARYVVLSYNSEGIIPMNHLLDILSDFGEISIKSLDYITYRGGRQSISRRTHNTEFQVVLKHKTHWGRPGNGTNRNIKKHIDSFIVAHHIQSLLQGSFVPERLDKNFETLQDSSPNYTVWIGEGKSGFALRSEHLYKFAEIPPIEDLQKLDIGELHAMKRKLEACACKDRQEDLQAATSILLQSRDKKERDRYQRRILSLLKKFTHKKYLHQWETEVSRLQELIEEDGQNLHIIRKGLDELIELARRRFEG